MTTYDMDPDVVRWGLHLLDVCTLSNSGSPSTITRYDPDLSQVEYVREGFYQPSYVENDEAVARAYQEELSQLESMEASGMSQYGNEQVQSVLVQDWISSSNGNYNHDNESCQSSNHTTYDMKVESYGQSERENENDAQDIEVYDSSSGSGEIPVTSDDLWDSLEISDESCIDGEVGKRLNQMVPIPHVPKTNEKIPSYDEELSDHQRLLDSYLDMLENNPDMDRNESLGQFIKSRGYSELFQKAYLIPICGSIWSCSSEGVMSFSAFSVLSFCRNHHLLQLFGRPQWLTVRWRSQNYVKKVKEELLSRGSQIIANCEVKSVSTSENGCVVHCKDGSQEMYDGCIMAVHAPDALRLLGEEATYDERRILGAFQYVYSDIFLHRDKNLMPRNPAAWSAWNFLGNNNNGVSLTYWLNILQNIEETSSPFLVTLNPDHTPENTLLKWQTGHPVPSVAAYKASRELEHIQGKRSIWFSGAYQGYGFHEDGLKAGMIAAHGILGRCCDLQTNPKHMVPSWTELGARLFVTRFLSSFISTGSLTLLEEGGTMFTFEGTEKKCSEKCVLRIHSPQFYWKVMTQADLGIADAYINGDFSFVDKDKGLLNLFLILIVNRDSNATNSKLKNRGWWTPIFFTAGLASAKFFIEHVSRQNTLTQARRNISRHYDLSNELFALFLDETMTYSCAVFKNEDEDLKDAQMRKISLLIEKARIDQNHEILEIGCGWGSLAIEVVKRTGCKYTGITLSTEQLKLAEKRVKDAGLQDHIKFLLCDYRQLPKTHKYDRIISCEMVEAVGHEYMEEFFGCCDSVLAHDGLLVLQFISIPDERYNEYRRSSDFIKEYIFPGGCLPSLSRITSAMAAGSGLCVEHVENIGVHYYQTLRCWRKNFMERQSEILALKFNEKFIRTWEYYFDYCGAGFKSRTLGNYQMVFSRPGNLTALKDEYKSWPSALC